MKTTFILIAIFFISFHTNFALNNQQDDTIKNLKIAPKDSIASNLSNTTNKTSVTMKRIYIRFTTFLDQQIAKEILIGFSEVTTDEFDYGYEAENSNPYDNDLGSLIGDKMFNIQALSDITDDKIVPLGLKSCSNNTFEIRITKIDNIDASQEIYLKDKYTNTYFNLASKKGYLFSSYQGDYKDRFEIVFKKEEVSLNIDNKEKISSANFYYENATNKLFVKNLDNNIKNLAFINITGQTVLNLNNISKNDAVNGISTSYLPKGIYILNLNTSSNQNISKKIIIN